MGVVWVWGGYWVSWAPKAACRVPHSVLPRHCSASPNNACLRLQPFLWGSKRSGEQARSGGWILTPAWLLGKCRGLKMSLLLMALWWARLFFPPASGWGNTTSFLNCRSRCVGGVNLWCRVYYVHRPTQPLSPAPGSHQKPGSVASGWPHAPLGDQSPFPSSSFSLLSRAWLRWVSPKHWSLGSRVSSREPVFADTRHTNTELTLVTAFQLMPELPISAMEQLPCELLTNVMEFCYSKIPPCKGHQICLM